jgi:hypothetical protein
VTGCAPAAGTTSHDDAGEPQRQDEWDGQQQADDRYQREWRHHEQQQPGQREREQRHREDSQTD